MYSLTGFNECEHEDGEAFADVFSARGWSVRRGHRRRLEYPKRGRAAVLAEIHGQGIEVHRGLTAFKRSVNNGSRRSWMSPECVGKYGKDWRIHSRRTLLRQTACAAAHEFLVCSAGGFDVFDDVIDDVFEDSEVEWQSELIEDGDVVADSVWRKRIDANAGSDTCSTSSTTLADVSSDGISVSLTCASCQDEVVGYVQVSPSATPKRTITPWEKATARAEFSAQSYAIAMASAQVSSTSDSELGTSRSRKRICKRSRRDPFAEELELTHNTRITDEELRLPGPFEEFRRNFLKAHGRRFVEGLQRCFNGPIRLRPTPLAEEVQQRFFRACTGELAGTLCPAYHGTPRQNLASIYQRGLLIPNVSSNGVRVANGAVHGLGIYTAKVEYAFLSWSYCWSSVGNETILVCGVLDGGAEEVLHAGQSMVIFNIKRVAPLFEATRADPPPSSKPSKPRRPRPAFAPQPPRRQRARLIRQQPPKVGVVAWLSRRAARKRRTR